jgi:tetratricopeptide (TPR) repeat protein
VRLAQKHLATGDYDAARVLLMKALPNASGRDRLRAQIYLVKANVRLGDFAAAETLLRQVRDGFQTKRDLALRPLISLTSGELEYERGRLHDARAAFDEGAQLVTRELTDDTAVEASAYRGLLEAANHADQARRIVNESLALAQRIGHLSLAARCRVFLARIDVGARRFDEALSTLRDVPRDDESRMIEPEIRAQVLYWSGRARAGKADTRGAEEIEAGRRLIQDVATRIPEGFRSTFLTRASVRELLR